jgi:hypothetical protein
MRIAYLAGGAAVALALYAGLAHGDPQQIHVLTLRLPGGRIEQVRYVGDVPPTVTLGSDAMTASFDPMPAFAMMDQVAAAMHRQAEALLRTINTAPEAGGAGSVPALSGPTICMRSVQVTYTGNGRAPNVVSQASGDCGSAHDGATQAVLPNAPAPKPAPNLVEAKNTTPYQRLVHTVGDWRR